MTIKYAYKKGFLLIEVLIALALLSGLAVTISNWYAYTLATQKALIMKLKADELASSFLEIYRCHKEKSLSEIKEMVVQDNFFQGYQDFTLRYSREHFEDYPVMLITVALEWYLHDKKYSYSLATGVA